MGMSEYLHITSGADAILGEAVKCRCSCGWAGEGRAGEAGGWSARGFPLRVWLRYFLLSWELLGWGWGRRFGLWSEEAT